MVRWSWLIHIASVVVFVVGADANAVARVSVDDGADVYKDLSTFDI